jgi:hypothetical protein
MNYFLIGGIFCIIIGVILTVYIPSATQKNKEYDDPTYKRYDIKAMEIFSYIFFAIGGILTLISFFKK